MQDYALTHCGHGKRRGEPCDVCDKLDAAHEKIVAENVKLREQLAILIEGAEAADELIMILKNIARRTRAKEVLAKVDAYHKRYT